MDLHVTWLARILYSVDEQSDDQIVHLSFFEKQIVRRTNLLIGVRRSMCLRRSFVCVPSLRCVAPCPLFEHIGEKLPRAAIDGMQQPALTEAAALQAEVFTSPEKAGGGAVKQSGGAPVMTRTHPLPLRCRSSTSERRRTRSKKGTVNVGVMSAAVPA